MQHHRHPPTPCGSPPVTPSYLRAYQRRRAAAACTAIRSAAAACIRQGLSPATAPDQADAELAVAWSQHLSVTHWQDTDR